MSILKEMLSCLQKLSVISDVSSVPMQTASKGKTAKKKTKGDEGMLLQFTMYHEYCYVTTS